MRVDIICQASGVAMRGRGGKRGNFLFPSPLGKKEEYNFFFLKDSIFLANVDQIRSFIFLGRFGDTWARLWALSSDCTPFPSEANAGYATGKDIQ